MLICSYIKLTVIGHGAKMFECKTFLHLEIYVIFYAQVQQTAEVGRSSEATHTHREIVHVAL